MEMKISQPMGGVIAVKWKRSHFSLYPAAGDGSAAYFQMKVKEKKSSQWCVTIKFSVFNKYVEDGADEAGILFVCMTYNCVFESGGIHRWAHLFPASDRQVNTHSPGCEASGRQVVSLCVKIAAGNPIALTYEACQYPDCNKASAET